VKFEVAGLSKCQTTMAVVTLGCVKSFLFDGW